NPLIFFFSSRRRHTRFSRDWSSDVCSSDLFIIFTDDNTENFEIPKNVKIEEYSIKKFNESASKILGIPIDISTPYKLVRVKYMNNGNDINIQLAETKNNEPISNGVQKIYYKSPLAVSLLGHTVGDIVKIGNLDNFVEIIKITNYPH